LKFNYSEINDGYGIDAAVINSETGNIIVTSHNVNNEESRKFLKMATKLINEKFENNKCINPPNMTSTFGEFGNEYNNILMESHSIQLDKSYIDLAKTTKNQEILEIIDKIDFWIESQNYKLPGLVIWYLAEDYYKESPKVTIVPKYIEECYPEYKSLCKSDEIFATFRCSSLEEFREECDKYDKMFENNLIKA